MKIDAVENIKGALEAIATEQNRISGQRFFKEPLCQYYRGMLRHDA